MRSTRGESPPAVGGAGPATTSRACEILLRNLVEALYGRSFRHSDPSSRPAS